MDKHICFLFLIAVVILNVSGFEDKTSTLANDQRELRRSTNHYPIYSTKRGSTGRLYPILGYSTKRNWSRGTSVHQYPNLGYSTERNWNRESTRRPNSNLGSNTERYWNRESTRSPYSNLGYYTERYWNRESTRRPDPNLGYTTERNWNRESTRQYSSFEYGTEKYWNRESTRRPYSNLGYSTEVNWKPIPSKKGSFSTLNWIDGNYKKPEPENDYKNVDQPLEIMEIIDNDDNLDALLEEELLEREENAVLLQGAAVLFGVFVSVAILAYATLLIRGKYYNRRLESDRQLLVNEMEYYDPNDVLRFFSV